MSEKYVLPRGHFVGEETSVNSNLVRERQYLPIPVKQVDWFLPCPPDARKKSRYHIQSQKKYQFIESALRRGQFLVRKVGCPSTNFINLNQWHDPRISYDELKATKLPWRIAFFLPQLITNRKIENLENLCCGGDKKQYEISYSKKTCTFNFLSQNYDQIIYILLDRSLTISEVLNFCPPI